jgi:hypothetical protein
VSPGGVLASQKTPPIRGTQFFVEHMGSVFRRPSLVAIEIAWRWLFGIPFLLVCWRWAILTLSKAKFFGLDAIDSSNPWHAATQLSDAWSFYQPLVENFLGGFLPLAAVAWIVISALGRSFILKRLDSHLRPRPITLIVLQAAWLCLFSLTMWAWYGSMGWIARTHIRVAGEPNLIGYFIWAIFLSLGFFTAWALVSWTVSIAPLLAVLENHSLFAALAQSLRLGKPFSSKLIEINLVLGIVKLALAVVAMVISAAPLPFSDELGPQAMHLVWAASIFFFLAANDYFHVVRLKAFLEFWKLFRGPQDAQTAE